jgi:hypothetical protein
MSLPEVLLWQVGQTGNPGVAPVRPLVLSDMDAAVRTIEGALNGER